MQYMKTPLKAKAFRFTEEDIRLIDRIKTKYGAKSDVEAIRYALRMAEKTDRVLVSDPEEEYEFAKFNGYLWRDQTWDAQNGNWDVIIQNPQKPFNRETLCFESEDPRMKELKEFLSPRNHAETNHVAE